MSEGAATRIYSRNAETVMLRDGRTALAVSVSDDRGDGGGWDLTIEAQLSNGKWGRVGKVRVTPPSTNGGVQARIVAVASIPGAIGWAVRPAGDTTIREYSAEISLSTSDHLAAPLVAISPFSTLI